MIPALLGNFFGGALFVAAPYWYLYLTGEGNVEIDFNVGSIESAMESGGPMKRTPTDKQQQRDENTIVGLDPNHLPHSGGQLQSSVSKELANGSDYTKSHAERTKGSDDDSNGAEKV